MDPVASRFMMREHAKAMALRAEHGEQAWEVLRNGPARAGQRRRRAGPGGIRTAAEECESSAEAADGRTRAGDAEAADRPAARPTCQHRAVNV